MQQIHIPNERLRRQAFQTDLTLSSRALLANPNNSKLRLILIMLEMENLARSNGTDQSLQHGSAIADISDLGMLRERHGLGVHAPDAHGQECRDTSIATTIHRPRSNPTVEKVRHIHG
jgi:hypothetical protein